VCGPADARANHRCVLQIPEGRTPDGGLFYSRFRRLPVGDLCECIFAECLLSDRRKDFAIDIMNREEHLIGGGTDYLADDKLSFHLAEKTLNCLR
jgi:hypothetical protein